jgi:hypothetical protein
MLDDVDLSRFITCPLRDDELQDLERAAAQPIPSGFRHFLSKVGFPQNLVPSAFQDERAILEAQVYGRNVGFVFAEPGEVVLAETPSGAIVEIDGDRQRLAHGSFDDFVVSEMRDPTEPALLCWAVQLCFATDAESGVRATLQELLGVTFADRWQQQSLSSAGVTSECALPVNGRGARLKRLSYPGWSTPMFFLNQSVAPPSMSEFKSYVRGWSASPLGFKLVNYGILPKEISEQDA